MKRYCFITATLLLTFGPLPQILSQTNSPNLKLVAHLDPLPNRTGNRASFSEVTGSGDLAILGGFEDFFVWIYDLSDRNRPELLATIPIGTPAWDVQVHGRYLFVALSGAMAWYDIIDPRQPRLVKRYSPTPPINPHTFFVAGNTLYVADYGVSPAHISIFDITDKQNPKRLSPTSSATVCMAHGSTARRDCWLPMSPIPPRRENWRACVIRRPGRITRGRRKMKILF
jgi:hypothetical protein